MLEAEETKSKQATTSETHKATHSDGISFPLSRVKLIMKADKDVVSCGNDVVLAIAASTELFIEWLAREATRRSMMNKRKTVAYKDVANAVAEDPRLHFLSDIIPKTMPLAEAIQYRRKKLMEMDEDGAVAAPSTDQPLSAEVTVGQDSTTMLQESISVPTAAQSTAKIAIAIADADTVIGEINQPLSTMEEDNMSDS